MDNVIIGIGKRVKQIRKENNQIISDLAQKAGVSNGLISRVENGRTIPSLPVLLNIIGALEINILTFFENIELNGSELFFVRRFQDMTTIEKEEGAKGFIYSHIFSKQLLSNGFEVVLLEVEANSQREKVVTDAFEFKYMITGQCEYIIGEEIVQLNEGDSIFFDGRIPHVPQNRTNESCKMLVVYLYNPTN